ncbi:MAG: tetratricopeptide repeat protein, partial [Hyphomicrobium sp.]
MPLYGFLLENGLGGPRNLPDARRWYQKAAEAGDRVGMYDYGLALIQGKGGPRMTTEGRAWLKKAADLGDPDARRYLKRNRSGGRRAVPKRSSNSFGGGFLPF